MMESEVGWDRCSEVVDQLAEAISQVGAAFLELLLSTSEMVLALCKQLLKTIDLSSLAELGERWRIEWKIQEEDRQKILELKLVSKRIVKLSKDKRTKVRKKNMNRIRKELRLYEKRR